MLAAVAPVQKLDWGQLELEVPAVGVQAGLILREPLEVLTPAAVGAAQEALVLMREAQAAPVSSSSKSINNMTTKTYRFLGIDTAMHLLRPGAKWEISNNVFTRWDDPRPCPSIEEVYWVIDKIREFEDSIPTIYTDEQLKEMGIAKEEFERAIA
jgi:hypothetical protein